jgi:hypothetical protein
MTEDGWLACIDPQPMIQQLRGQASQRKWRLFAVACCNQIEHMISRAGDYAQVSYRRAIEVAERYADQNATHEELIADCGLAGDCAYGQEGPDPFQLVASPNTKSLEEVAEYAQDVAYFEFSPEIDGGACERALNRAKVAQCDLLRDVFGNPFRPVSLDPAWRTSTVVTLAEGMYESRDFGAMPILADALQDAGCDNVDVLNHCRDTTQPHVRGCWVVDLLTGRA